MKNKYWVLIIAALTVIGTFWTQTELGGKKYRTHQHKEYLSVEDTTVCFCTGTMVLDDDKR